MWSPTHVHVIVQKAENLIIKGKNGTNNTFVIIELGKERYRTSIKEKSGKYVVWNEECELKIPKIGNAACIVLTAVHRNSLGLDQFLGTVKIPLASFDKFQRTSGRFILEGKPGKEKGKDKIRGELEVEIGFTSRLHSQSLTSLKSEGKSFEVLSGSLFGLRQKDRKVGVKNFANTLSRIVLKKRKQDLVSHEDNSSVDTNKSSSESYNNNLDPGVISDEEDNTSHKSSESLGNSIEKQTSNVISNLVPPAMKPHRTYLRNPQISVSNWEEDNKIHLNSALNISFESVSSAEGRRNPQKLEELQSRLRDRRLSSSCVDFSLLESSKPEKKFSSTLHLEKAYGGESHKRLSKLARKFKNFHSLEKKDVGRMVSGSDSQEKVEEESSVPKLNFKNKNKEELINMVVDLQKKVNRVSVRVKDLEDYLDEILLKVMETVPKILEKS